MKASEIFESLSNEVRELKAKIGNPSVTVAQAKQLTKNTSFIKHHANNYMNAWKTRQKQLRTDYGDVLTDSIKQMELQSIVKTHNVPEINKIIQDIVDYGEITNHTIRERFVDLLTANFVHEAKKDSNEAFWSSDHITPNSIHHALVVVSKGNERWVKFDGQWFWDKDKNFRMTHPVSDDHYRKLESYPRPKQTMVKVVSVDPMQLQRMRPK